MTCCTVNKFVSVRLFFALYVVDAHQDFYMRIAMRISAYADHPHEPHGSATAWPSLVCIGVVEASIKLSQPYVKVKGRFRFANIRNFNDKHW